MPVERSEQFGATVRRLGSILGPERLRLMVVLVLAVGGVVLVVIGPRLLGQATDIIVQGVTSDEGMDFGALHRKLMLAAGLYAAAWVLAYGQAYILAGVVQRTMYALRQSVEDKLNRLPLSYVDRQSRGDLLSRVTNDIDNLAQSLQQTVSQILTSLLTLVGVTVMMFTISPLLAVVALVTVPLSLWVMKVVSERARPRFISQWRYTGSVNGQTEEVFTGHAIVKSFGRQRDAEARFAADNDALYETSFGAQFTAGTIQPLMVFFGNIQFVLIAVVGGLADLERGDLGRRHAGDDPVRPPVLDAAHATGVDDRHVPVRHRLARAGASSCSTRPTRHRTTRRARCRRPCAGGSCSRMCTSPTCPTGR